MKSLLVVIDYQNDFVDGSLGFEKAVLLYPKIKERIEKAIEEKEEIVFTADTHQKDYLSTIEGKNLPVVHCLEGSEGHRFYKDIEKLSEGYPVFRKDTFPCKEFFTYFKNKEYEKITLIGVVLNICVLSNAVILKALFPNTPIIVDSSLCASNDEALEKEGYDILRNLHIEVI